MAGDYLLDYGLIFAVFVLIDDIGPVDSRNGLVRGYLDNIELINGGKLLRLGYGGTGHAGEFVVKSEVILEGDGRKSFILALNIDMLLGLYRLVKSVAVPSSEHHTACKLINDDDFPVSYNIVHIPLHHVSGLESLHYMVVDFHIVGIGKILNSEEALALCHTLLGKGNLIILLVNCEVPCFNLSVRILRALNKGLNEAVRSPVHVRGLVASSGNDKRCSGFVD